MGGLFGVAPGNYYLNLLNSMGSDVGATANALVANNFQTLTVDALAAKFVANLGLTGDLATSGTAFVVTQLKAAGAANYGKALLTVANNFAALANDSTSLYATAATSYNTVTANALTYSQNTANNSTDLTVLATGFTATPVAQAYTLTTNVETLDAKSGTVSGVIATSASTFQTGDAISNAKSISLTGANTVGNTIRLTNVDALTITDLAGVTLSADLYSGVKKITNNGTSTTVISNGELATVYGVSSTGGLNVGIRAADTAGTADTLNFAATSVGTKTGSVAGGYTTTAVTLTSPTAIEKVAVDTTGTNYITVSASTTAATDSKTLAVTGDGNNTITASSMTQATLFDLSAAKGTNTLSLGSALTTGMTIKGGTGADTLSVTQNSTAANLTVTGVETLNLNKDYTAGNFVFTAAPNFTTIRVGGDASESGTETLNAIGAPTTLNYVGDGLTTSAAAQMQFGTLTVNSSFTGSADTLALNIGNQGTSMGAGVGYQVAGTTTLNGVETLNITVADTTATGTAAFATGITDNALTTLKVTATGNVTLGTVTGTPSSGGGLLALVDLTNVAGTSASTMTIANNTISGATTILAATGGTSVTVGGAESSTDQIIYTGAAGVDTLDAMTNSFAGVVVVDGKGGNDVLKGGIGADVLTGGEGADQITGFKGNDTIILTETVAAQDTVIFGDTAANNGTDTIIGFTSADLINVNAFFGAGKAGMGDLTTANGTGSVNKTVYVFNVNAAIANKAYGGADFGDLFAAGTTGKIKTAPGANNDKILIAVQGTDQTQLLYVDDALDTAGTFKAADVLLVGTLSNLTNATTLATGNFA